MKKFLWPAIFATIFIFIGGTYLFSRNSSSSPTPVPSIQLPTSYEYFWGDGCPHCATVAEFFNSWENKDKVNIDKKEVWSNKENSNLMLARANYCGIKPSDLGVPFLFTPEGKCISGDQPIIEFFKNLPL